MFFWIPKSIDVVADVAEKTALDRTRIEFSSLCDNFSGNAVEGDTTELAKMIETVRRSTIFALVSKRTSKGILISQDPCHSGLAVEVFRLVSCQGCPGSGCRREGISKSGVKWFVAMMIAQMVRRLQSPGSSLLKKSKILRRHCCLSRPPARPQI